MFKLSVDWTRPPEMKWTKQLCPICREPTGPSSQCYEKGDEADISEFGSDVLTPQPSSQFSKTIEYNGQIVPILSQQCIFRRFNTFLLEFNYPVSKLLAVAISSCEGVEQLTLESKYKAILTIGNQFSEKEVKAEVSKIYKEFVFEYRDKALLSTLNDDLEIASDENNDERENDEDL